jgi:hypothetical protein
MSQGSKRWLASSHHLGYIEASLKTKIPLRPNTRIHTPRGTLGIFVFAPSDGCSVIANLLSLNASLAISTCVLRFEVTGLRHRTPVRPVLLTGQTGPMLLHLCLRSWLCGSTKEPSGFMVNHQKPRELGVASANHHS